MTDRHDQVTPTRSVVCSRILPASRCLRGPAVGAAGPTIATPFKRTRRLSTNQKAVNRNLSRAHAQGERAAATLKCRKVLTKLRCCPTRATLTLAAITMLQHIEQNRPLPR